AHRTEPDTQDADKAAARVCIRDLFIENLDHLAAEIVAQIPGVTNKSPLVNTATDVEDGRVVLIMPHGVPTSCAGQSAPASPYDLTPLRTPCGPYVTVDNSGDDVPRRTRSRSLQSVQVPVTAGWSCTASPVPS